MTVYFVTISNWNTPSFWSGISEGTSGHTLDFSGLTSAFSVDVDKATGEITIDDGATSFVIGESGYVGPPAPDTNLGAGTSLDFFTSIVLPNGDASHIGDGANETLNGGDGNDSIEGLGGDDSIIGGLGDDTLSGGEGINFLNGGGGADVITAGSGSDTTYGGNGNDTIALGAGDDRIYGDDGNDSLQGEAGHDVIFGGNDTDTLHGDAGNDTLYGDAGADLLFGGDGEDYIEGGWDGSNDTVYGGAGFDDFYMGDGDDSVFGGDDDDQVLAGDGDDYVQGDGGNDILVGHGGADTLLGGIGDDTLTGGAGPGLDSLLGGDGSDHLYGYAGDIIDGGEGGIDNDTLFVGNVDTITYTTAESGTISFTTGGSLTFNNIEFITQFAPDGIVQGTSAANAIGHLYIDADGEWIDNNDASGVLGTVNHDDYVQAGDGEDTVWGLEGNDIIHGDAGADLLYGGADNDRLIGGADNDSLHGGDGNDTLLGGAGNDSLTGYADNDSILGGDGADFLSGWGGDDTLYGEAGDDTLYGGGGADSIFGGDGADLIAQNQVFGADTIEGGEGGTDQDTLSFTGSDSAVNLFLFGPEAGTFTQDGESAVGSFIQIENFILSDFDDSMSGASNTTAMEIEAGSGNDTVSGGLAADSIAGQEGADTLFGNAGNDTLDGGDGNDNLHGQTGDDLLRGGAGSDDLHINEGQGTDTAEGGESTGDNDRLVLNASGAQGVSVTMTGAEAGTYSFDSTNGSGTFTEMESILMTNQDDTFDGSAAVTGMGAAGFGGDDSLRGGAGNDTFQGDQGQDTLRGGAGDDGLSGGDDADLFIIEDGFGSDDIYGGEGVTSGVDQDMLDFSALSAGVNVTGNGSVAERGTASSGADTLNYREVESFTLTAQNDTFTGTSGDETVVGGDGNDYIDGGAGDDVLKAGNGQDTLIGGTGNDTLMNAAGDDSLVGGAGDDLIIATAGNDTLEGNAGNDTLMGGTDNDSLVGGADNDLLLGDLAGVEFNATGTDGAGIASGITDFPTSQLTYELTFSSTASTAGFTPLASYSVAGSPDEFILYIENGTLRAGFDNTTFVDTGLNPPPLFDGDVHTLAVTWDSATGAFEVFLDGVSSFTDTVGTGLTLETGGTFVLGQDQDAVGGGFDTNEIFEGTIYGASLYDDIRTDAEISASSLGPIADASDPNLVANWVADPNGTTFTDQTGNHAMVTSGDVQADWSNGNDSLLGGDGDDTLYAGGGDDSLSGGDGADYLEGGTGSNYYESGLGADTIDDTNGNWGVASYFGSDAAVTINLMDGTTETGGWAEGDTIIGVTQIDGSDFFGDQITGGSEIRLIKGWGGDDTLAAGSTSGDSTLEGGTGDDSVTGASGNDNLLGGDGADTLAGEGGNDTLLGAEGNDSLRGDSGDDSLVGGTGDDILVGNTGNDTLDGGEGADRFDIWAGDNAATVIGGETGDDSDILWLISAGDGYNVTFDGDETGDAILSDGTAVDFSQIEQIWGSRGADTVDASASSAAVTVVGNDGDDSILGSSDADFLRGDTGSDTLDGGLGDDTLTGGNEDDTLTGGAGNDNLTGGAGDDTFVYSVGDGLDTISDFNSGNSGTLTDGDATNNDFIDLSAFYDNIWELYADYDDDSILNQSNATTLNGKAVDFTDNSQFLAGEGIVFSGESADSSSFTVENTGVVCFTADTLILTPTGEVPIQHLRPGDAVVTRDNGVQRLVWSAARRLRQKELDSNPNLRPIAIKPTLVGAHSPLLVSPQHGMLVRGEDGDETLVRARHMARLHGGQARVARGRSEVVYIHLMFDAHQIIFANGAPSESFYPGKQALGALAPAPLHELTQIFPDLINESALQSYGKTARRFARFKELPETLRDVRPARA